MGRPVYADMHPQRQAECMRELKCQVGAGPASRTEDGYLFIDWRKPQDPPTWPEGALTTMPLSACVMSRNPSRSAGS
ncbi:hypothetical protein GCM10010357_67660 [Streptomyces luteireticuli]|uniref:Uncharacterized protein n=1 Tax=Streptomyces luteireticuli TaxID=173858 RepID=A0ABP3J107_9ACTN